MWTRRLSSRTVISAATLSLIGVIGFAACGGGAQQSATDTAAGSGAVGKPGGTTPVPSAPALQDAAQGGAQYDGSQRGVVTQRADLLTSGESVIKTGSVALRSDQIGQVLTRVYRIVGGVGGDVSDENTATNTRGNVVRSMLTLRVPVAHFDSTLDDLSQLGTLVDRIRSAKDVTTAVADIQSRVRSAHRSIDTLRLLFGRASRLGDIIQLESELSQREADLEALQAEQRALHDQTTMSTIAMTVEHAPLSAKPTPKQHPAAAGGFVSGIRQGWHALTRTMLAVGHGLGVVLPLGTVLLVLAALALWFVRRFAPGLAPAPKPTVES